VGFEAKEKRCLIKLGLNKWSVSFHEIVSCEISSDGGVEIWVVSECIRCSLAMRNGRGAV
jgi:hypothetical protein